MSLFTGQFYKTCATYPGELHDTSPLKSHELLVPKSPKIGEPLRISKNTSAWFIPNVKVAKPHSCDLAKFYAAISIGIIFLGSTSDQVHPHRFVTVYLGQSAPPNVLYTLPLVAFLTSFSLNLTHPLRVKLVYLQSGSSFHATKWMSLPGAPPPRVGITEYVQIDNGLLAPVKLDAGSEAMFLELQKAYHKVRPRRYYIAGEVEGKDGRPDFEDKGDGSGSSGPSDMAEGNGDWKDGRSDFEDKGDGSGSSGPSDMVEGNGLTDKCENMEASGNTESKTDKSAPWGMICGSKIGLDIPLIVEDLDAEESEEELEDTHVDGVVFLQDVQGVCV